MAKICLVSCVRSKCGRATKAKDLYISPLFRKARKYAERNADRWYILSAKHHLVDPEAVIAPYEKTLNKMPRAERREWSHQVFAQIAELSKPSDDVVFLAGERYREDLVPLLQERGNCVSIPMRGLSIGRQLQWLTQTEGREGITALGDFYRMIGELERALDGGRTLGNCSGQDAWPQRGVYLLYEPGEMRGSDSSRSRIVRVGTHMVSRGSTATLWNRLRTHRGHADGTGNHRGSVFRRHVGEAMLEQSQETPPVPTWGKGQSASKDVQAKEVALEKRVSAHIGRMTVLWLDVPDEAGPDSDRAFIEKNAIALLASAGHKVDPPSSSWLGGFSPTPSIPATGLWNVD